MDEEGFVSVIDTTQSNSISTDVLPSIPMNKWLTHNNAVFDVKWVPKSNQFVTASGDTTAALWDITRPEIKINSFHGHSCSLKSVCVSKHNPSKQPMPFYFITAIIMYYQFFRYSCNWIKRWKYFILGQ